MDLEDLHLHQVGFLSLSFSLFLSLSLFSLIIMFALDVANHDDTMLFFFADLRLHSFV